VIIDGVIKIHTGNPFSELKFMIERRLKEIIKVESTYPVKESGMKVMAFNGSPRKKWNTATLLQHALDGAASKGAQSKMIHLYDINYQGCVSCFSCKKAYGKNYGKCATKDDLTPILEEIPGTDILIFGSPFYFGTVTGQMRSFMERLLFPFYPYVDPPDTLFPRKIPTGFIYTLGATEALCKERGFDHHIRMNAMFIDRVFGATETLCCYDTYQFEDYSKVYAPRFDPEKKAKRRQEVFPVDCSKAFELGARLAAQVMQ
jgi:multimeric flavodoxin WrbA